MQKEYKHIEILDLLSNDERRRDSETSRLESILQTEISINRIEIDTKDDLLNHLRGIKPSMPNAPVMLHFAAHGAAKQADPPCSARGLAVSNQASVVSWEELRPVIESLNSATHGNIVLNVMACRGSNAFKIDDFLGTPAFRAVIGPHRDLAPQKVIELTEKFYAKLINGDRDILATPQYVEEINIEEGSHILNLVTAGYLRKRASEIVAGITNPAGG